MTEKIRGWGHRHLSYAAHCQLLQGVLYSIQSFWSRIFFLPHTIVDKLTMLCRRFLWAGQCENRVWAPIAWEVIFRPKVNKGLGFKEILSWNKASMLRLVYDITSNGPTLWVRWVSLYQLRHTTFLGSVGEATRFCILEETPVITWWGAVLEFCRIHGECAWFFESGLGENWLPNVLPCVTFGSLVCCDLAPMCAAQDAVYHVVIGNSWETTNTGSRVLLSPWDCKSLLSL